MTTTFRKGEMLSKMLMFATNAHHGQFDLGGKPYILHPLKVMYYLKSEDEELQCIALGHDVVEDCGVTYQQLYEEGFTDRIVAGIKAMTKVPGQTFGEYKAQVKANPDAVKVKMCDLRHNSDIRRLKGIGEKEVKRIEKYHAFWTELKELTDK